MADKEKEEEFKLKTLCEFLITQRFLEVADFSRFETCFKPLFINENISLENVFDYIVGVFESTNKKRKYITYTRFHEAYSKYKEKKNQNNIPKDVSIFFEKLFNSILKIVDKQSNFIGVKESDFSSLQYLDDDFFSLSRLKILCNKEHNILGFNLEYNEKDEVNMYSEKKLYKALDLKLEIEIKKNFPHFLTTGFKNDIRDSITHIFGTFNQKITSIGFKCVSGKTIHFGQTYGNPFLFGAYGKKLQCLNIKIEGNGITGLEIHFSKNPLKNNNIELQMNGINKIYFDEKQLLKVDKNYELIRKNKIKYLDNDDSNSDNFDGEDILIKPIFQYILKKKSKIGNIGIKNDFMNNSTIIINEDKNYLSYPNPFFPLDENQELMIQNPFFPEEHEKQRKQFERKKNIFRQSVNRAFDFRLNNSQLGNNEKNLSKTTIIEDKEKLKNNFSFLKQKIKTKIIDILSSQRDKNNKHDTDTKIALNIILEEDGDDDISNKITALQFLLNKFNFQNKALKEAIIKDLDEREENKDKMKQKLTIDKEAFEKLKEKNDKIETNGNDEEKLRKSINLFIDINNYKGKNKFERKEEKDKIDEIQEEEEKEEEEDMRVIDLNENDKNEKTKSMENNNKIKSDLKNEFRVENEQFESEIQNQIKKKKQEEILGFLIVEKKDYENLKQSKQMKCLNVLIKSFYSKKIDKNIQLFGNDKLPKKLKEWKDKIFTKENALGIILSNKKNIIWKRPDESEDYYIFRNDLKTINIKPSSNNIKHIYLMAALGALWDKSTDDSNPIKDMFHITEKTKERVYGIYFYINGKRQLILIDDYLPYDKNNNLFFDSSYYHSEIWVSLILKAWAKLRGSYINFSNEHTSEVFEALTGSYTKQIKINNDVNKDELWKILDESKNYPICAGTKSKTFLNLNLNFKKVGLKPKYEYIVKVLENEKRKVLLREPYSLIGNSQKIEVFQNGDGIVTISYEDFYNYFELVEINYFNNFNKNNQNILNKENDGNKINFIEISQKESSRCQFIKIENYYENNELFINLYQNYQQKPVFSYILLTKKEKNDSYSYINSITSLTSQNNSMLYEKHIALNKILLTKGRYYICCDINYRFLDKFSMVDGYSLKIISNENIKIENVTKNIHINERTKIFQESLIHFVEKEKVEEYTNGNNYTTTIIQIFKDKYSLPFDIFYFYNRDKVPCQIKFEINEKQGIYYIYNDDEVSEIDQSLAKKIMPGQKKVIMIMNYEYSLKNNNKNKKYLKYEVDRIGDEMKKDINFEHLVFNDERRIQSEALKNKLKVFKVIANGNLGIILGIENITNEVIKVKLETKNLFICNPKEWHYDDEDMTFRFFLKKKEKRIICLRKKAGFENLEYFLDLDRENQENIDT